MSDLRELMAQLCGDEPPMPDVIDQLLADGRRGRGRRRASIVATAATSILVIGIAIGVPLALGTSKSTSRVSIGDGQTIKLDASGDITFTPRPNEAASAPLTAQQAWQEHANGAPLPPSATAEYGTASWTNNFTDRYVWAFRTYGSCQSHTVRPQATSTRGLCTTWVLLDPTTAQDVIDVSSSTPAPPIKLVANATASGILPTGAQLFSPPVQPQTDMSARRALDIAWAKNAVPGATDVRMILGRVQHRYPDGIQDTDVWFAIFDGACLQFSEVNPATDQRRPCVDEPETVVIDATTGKNLFTFAGGRSKDPEKVLIPAGP